MEAVRQRWTALACLGLAAVTLAVYAPAGDNGFISYDDGDYVTGNPRVLGGLSWADARWAFTTAHASNWHPLTWLSHELDVQLFGLRAWGHHWTSVLLHTANAVLLFLVLRGMTRECGVRSVRSAECGSMRGRSGGARLWRGCLRCTRCMWNRWRGWRNARMC